jgi:hypothetical protein
MFVLMVDPPSNIGRHMFVLLVDPPSNIGRHMFVLMVDPLIFGHLQAEPISLLLLFDIHQRNQCEDVINEYVYCKSREL